MKTTVIRILGFENCEVIQEADQLIADQLKELNRRSKYCYTTTELAKPYGMKSSDLLSFLRDRKIIVKQAGDYQLTRSYRNQGLADYRYSLKYNQQGKMKVKKSLVWTEKGREFLRSLIEK